jgi:hypothetical protein
MAMGDRTPASVVLVRASDLELILPRVEQQVTLTPYERNAARRLREAADAAKEKA